MVNNNDYKIDFTEASKILGKSERTLSRYVKKKLIIPEIKKSQKGIKYYFNLAELENFKKLDTTGQMTRQAKVNGRAGLNDYLRGNESER